MAFENETPEEEVIRLAEEAKATPQELTEEQIEAAIQKRYGVSSDQLMKKEDQVKVLSEEEKQAIADERNAKVLTTAIEKKWFTQKEYDDLKTLQATGKVSIAKQKFIEDNPDLGDKAGEKFDKIFRLDEADEIEENEEMVPNEAKALATKQLEKMSDDYLKTKYGKITEATGKYEQHVKESEIATKNVATFTKVTAAIPEEVEIPIGESGTTVKYKITEQDRKEAQGIFLGDKKLVVAEKIDEKELAATALRFIQAKNIESILESAVNNAIALTEDRISRGEKGIVPNRDGKAKVNSEAREYLKEIGIKV